MMLQVYSVETHSIVSANGYIQKVGHSCRYPIVNPRHACTARVTVVVMYVCVCVCVCYSMYNSELNYNADQGENYKLVVKCA